MTEAEWLARGDPTPMLEFVGSAVSNRKLRLFGVACCRRIWVLMPDVKCELAVDIAASHADGYCDDEVLRMASQKVTSALGTLSLGSESAEYAATAAAYVSSQNELARTAEAAAAAHAMQRIPSGWAEQWDGERLTECRHQAALLRDIIGNPFRPVTFNPAWRRSDVMLLAQGIYDDRAFDRMPILADALQDAGCDNDDILNHLRDVQATHVRGCWALDLVLGKE